MRSPATSSKSILSHIPALDGVRGLAMLVVLVHNTAWVIDPSQNFLLKVTSAVASAGWGSVQLFFVLSGFLITRILLEAQGSDSYFRTFFTRRALRIFPLYYLSLIVAVFVLPRLIGASEFSERIHANQWWHWFYLSNWASPFGHTVPGMAHFWSVAVEEQFYLVWPFVVFFVPKRRLAMVCGAVLIATPLIRWGIRMSDLPPSAAYQFTIARWDALACGALLAIVLQEPKGQKFLDLNVRRITIATAGVLGIVTALRHGLQENDLWVQVVAQTCFFLLSAAVVFSAQDVRAQSTSRLNRVLSSHLLTFFGKYSYAIYLFHFPIHTALGEYVGGWVNEGQAIAILMKFTGYVLSVLALSVLGAMISWRLIEKPMLSLKDRLAPREGEQRESRSPSQIAAVA